MFLVHFNVRYINFTHRFPYRRGLNVPKDDSYLKNTKTAGAVVRSVLDEYNMFKDEMTFKSTRAVLEYDARYVHLQIVSL